MERLYNLYYMAHIIENLAKFHNTRLILLEESMYVLIFKLFSVAYIHNVFIIIV